ncbi:MAG: phage major capsid protein, partial [Betaproteobacteria bacterium]|nr:phage major capsid protein [Betaproteobacteria bacterium]
MERLSELTAEIGKQTRGLGFSRYVKALAAAHGKSYEARTRAAQWKHSTPRAYQALEDGIDDTIVTMALRDPGTTVDADWAAPLVNYKILVSEFVDMLRARTILGRLAEARKVPLGVKYLTQSGAATVAWVGENIPVPVGELSLSTETPGFAKASGILVVTQELLDSSTPDAEGLFSTELRAAMVQFFDEQFINPAVAAVANVSPASITNGASSIASSGTTVAAIIADFGALFAALSDINLIAPTLIMAPKTAIALALKRDSAGGPPFP